MIMWHHLIRASIGRSLMIYSYVVRQTWKSCTLRRGYSSFRTAGDPFMIRTRTDGAQRSNSSVQLVSVESGTMTRKGPGCRFFSIR